MTVRVYDTLDAERMERELSRGDVALVVDSAWVWVRSEDGELDEVAAPRSGRFRFVGDIHAYHPNDGPDAAMLGELGHIENHYFACYDSEWLWLGNASTPDEGLDLLKDYLGVPDPSWMWLVEAQG